MSRQRKLVIFKDNVSIADRETVIAELNKHMPDYEWIGFRGIERVYHLPPEVRLSAVPDEPGGGSMMPLISVCILAALAFAAMAADLWRRDRGRP